MCHPRLIVFTFILLLFINCNQEDNEDTRDEALSASDFKVLGIDNSNLYQIDYTGEGDEKLFQNISIAADIPADFLRLNQYVDVLNFFEFSQGAFSLSQWEVIQSTSASYPAFWRNEDSRGISWGAADFSRVYFGYFAEGSRNLGILDYDLITGTFIDVTIDFAIAQNFAPIILEDKVYFAYKDQQENYKFSYYNTTTQSSGPILNFGTNTISYFKSSENEIILLENDELAPVLKKLDKTSLQSTELHTLDLQVGFNSGPLAGADWVGDVFFYPFPNAQPARFVLTPALYDLRTKENKLLPIEDLVENLYGNRQSRFEIITQSYQPNNETVFLAYGFQGEEVEGGVLEISSKGILVNHVELPYFPFYFITN